MLIIAPQATKVQAQGTLKVGMTLADIPVSFGQPDQGFEGFRFMGLMLYDALINWDMSQGDKPSGLIPMENTFAPSSFKSLGAAL